MTASATSVQAGGTVLFRISAWAVASPAETGDITTTLTPSAKTPAYSQPKFTVDNCSSNPTPTSCDLSLPQKQPSAPEIEAEVTVPKTATAGEAIKYTATVSVANGSSSSLTATATAPTVTVAKTPTTSPTPTASKSKASGAVAPASTTPSGSVATIPGLSGYAVGTSIPIGALPAIAGVPGVSTTIPGGSASNLFPQINPSAVPSPAAGTPPAPGKTQPVADASTIPLSLTSSEFGAQILGLIVLLLGVAIAVTRLSLRSKSRAARKAGN